jgi:hypothetical protein
MTRTGSQRVAVLLCKFADVPAEPRPVSLVRDLVANRKTGGLNDYWAAASLGAIDLDGSDVYDWMPLDQTRSAFLAARPGRGDKVAGAMEAFPNVDFSRYRAVVAVFNLSPGDTGRSGDGVLAGPEQLNVTWLAHETGHVFGLGHSFDESSRRLETWSQPGEYCDRYDVMSAMYVDHTDHPLFGAQGPLLCTPNLDLMDWLPAARVWRAPQSGSSWSDTVELVSLSRPETPGYLAAVVGDKYIELRTREGWDGALPRAGVLIHRLTGPNAVILAKEVPPAKHTPSDLFGGHTYPQDWQPGETYSPDPLSLMVLGGTAVTVESIDEAAGTARVRISVRTTPPRVAGPATVLGGVTGDGGGWVILPSGKVVKIGPRGPVLSAIEALALVEHTNGMPVSHELQRDVTAAAVRELAQVIVRLQR